MAYYTAVGPRTGPLRYPDSPAALGVLDGLTRPAAIGLASAAGWDEDGVALWRLTIGDATLPGVWAVVDREFRPVK